MSGMDRYYEWKKEKETSSGTKSTGGGMEKYYEWQRIRNLDTSGVDESYINTFVSDANSFLSSAEKDYGTIGWANASSVYDGKSSTWKALSDRADTIEAWLYKNKANLDSEAYDNLSSAVGTYRSNASSIVDAFKNAKDYYSQWSTEDEYNTYEGYRSVLDSADHAEYSKAGASVENPTWKASREPINIFGWKPLGDGETINNMVTFAEANRDRKFTMQDAEKGDSDLAILVDLINKHMKDDEKAIYNYYIGKGDTEKADEYLSYITDTLHQREAGEIVSKYDNTALEYVFSAAAGLDNAFTGIKNLGSMITGSEGASTSSLQYAQSAMRSNNTGLRKVGNDLINTTANMLPSILVGSVTGGLGGALTLGASASGNAYAEMRHLGYDRGQSTAYAGLVGASEAALQYALGGISKLGGGSNGIFQTIAGKIVPSLDNAMARVAIEVGANMADEGLEEIIQELLDPFFKMAATGEDFEGIDIEQVFYSGLLGALSAGFLEGVPTVAGTAIDGIRSKKYFSGDVPAMLVEAGTTEGTGKVVDKYIEKYGKKGKLSGTEISNLLNITDKHKIKSAAEATLTKYGEKGDVGKIADVITKIRMGEETTKAERDLMANSEYGRRVSNESHPRNIKNGGYNTGWAENLGTRRINAKEYNKGNPLAKLPDLSDLKTPIAVAEPPEEGIAPEGKAASPEDIKTTIERDGEEIEVNIDKISSIGNGEMTLQLNGGETVNVSEVKIGGQMGLVYQAATDMAARVGGFNVDTANVFVKGFNPGAGLSAAEYVHGFSDAYRFGKLGYPVSELESGVYTSKLTKEQRTTAYNFGKVFGNDKVTENQSKIDSTKAINANKDSQKASKKGKVYYDGKVSGKSLTERQRASLKGLRVVAESLGMDIHIFESPLVNGQRVGENGSYDPVSKTLRIDLHAGVKGDGLMLFTASHELTHHIKEVAPAKFKIFADALLEEYTKRGQSVEELIEAKKEFLKEKGRITPNMTEEQAYDLAYEEVVADSCEAMLVDSNAIEALSRKVRAKDKGLWETIKDFISKLVARIKAAYKGLSPDSAEANYVRKMEVAAERLRKLWVDALLDASEVNTSERVLGEAGIIVDSETDSASLMSVRDVLTDADRKKVAKALSERFGVTQVEAMDWLKAETSLASLILNPKYSQYLDYTPDPNEVAIKTNSDYPQGTVDFSPICAKRREFTSVMNNILRLFPNHVFAATDLAKIRSIMQEEGMTIPCGICYVEDRRQLDTIVAQNFIDSLKLYRESSKIRPDGKPFNANQLKGLKLIDGDNYTPSVYELVSLEGLNVLKEKNPNMAEAWVKFNNARGMQSVRLLANEAEYKRQILKYSKKTVQSKNDHGGLRVYSFSDAEMFHLIDIIQVITDSATVGLSLQGYTKVNEYARAVKDTGEKLNRSLIPKGDLGYHIEDGKVVLDYDTVEGIDINHPDFFDNIDNPNVGNITIGVSDVQIRAAMVSNFVDQIIPFHTGQSDEVLGEKGIATWSNYKDFQTEKDIATGKVSEHQINIYTEVLQVLEAEGKPINKRSFVEKFLQVCKENNLTPRFSQFLNTDENGEYTYTEGYHKFLVDFKTFDQRTGEYLPQMPVKPIFDNEYITKILRDYVDSQKVKDAEIAKSMPKVIDRITKEIVKPEGNTKYSDRDSLGNTLSKEQQEYFKDSKVRDAKGNLMVLYHGTTANFNTFKKGDVGFHFGTKGAARGRVGFGKNVILKEVYLNVTNPIVFDEDLGSWDADFRLTRELYDKGILTQAEAESVLFTDDKMYKRTTEAANKKLASVLVAKGYDGIAYSNTFETKNPTTSYIVFNSNQAKEITNKAPTGNPDIRYSDRAVQPITEAEYESLEKHFGVTGNFRVAGYLLPNGKMLDFSGKHWGDNASRSRQVDHRDAGEVLERGNNGINDMIDMIGSGSIRLMPETGGINLAVYPNEKQRRVLSAYINYMLATEGQVIIDYDAVGGDTVYSRVYEKYSSSRQILSDIRNYFNGARQSDLMNFHTKYSDRDSHGNELSKAQKEFFKDSKARDEDGNLYVLFHGTSTENRITEFKTTEGWRTGLWLSTDHATAVHFARATEYVERDPSDDTRLFTKENSSDGTGRQGVYELYANVKNPLIVDAKGKRYWEIPRPSVMGEGNAVSGEEINAFAYENGYDGVIINDVVEGNNRVGTDVIVFSKNQVKYTDNLNPTEGNDIRYSDRNPYSYEALTSKPDMKLTRVGGNVPNSRADVVAEAKKNATKVGKFNPKDGSVSVFVDDIGVDVILSKRGLVHSLDRRLQEIAPVTIKAGEIIKNSIKINELTPSKKEAEASYILVGAAQSSNGDLYIVRSVVNKFSNELDTMDVLYAINAKKSTAVLNAPLVSTPNYRTTISIAQLLEFVNEYFPDILPESVLRHYGHTERPEGKLGESALYSDRVTDKKTLDFLNEQLRNGEVTKVYRAMQAQPVDENGNVIKATVMRVVSQSPLMVEAKTFGKNGKVDIYPAKLFSPMAGMVNGKWSKSIDLNKWEETTFDLAHATTAIDKKTGKPKIDNDKKNASYGEIAYFYGLVKGGIDDDGKKLTDIPARYNPYIHTSLSALNDQFSSANKRPELVTVECIIPNSELTSGFRAEGAKDRVGAMSWHSGPTSSRLAKVGKARTVILTRYDMPVRVLPDSEVAKAVAEYIGDTENIAIQGSTVTPSLSRELMNLGISVLNEEQWSQYNEDFPAKTFGKTQFSDRDTDSFSNRSLLSSALETAAQNDIEREKLKQYKQKIDLINAEEQKLQDLRAKIKELSFAKGPRDTKAIRDLQFEANQAANRINTYDRQLLNLESTKALKGVLEREKAQAFKRAEKKGKEALARQREKAAETQRELMNRYQESRKRGVESRNKTAMRHKIKDVVNELNQYLLKGTKEKHIPIELQKPVAEALAAVNMDSVGAEERIARLQAEMMKAKTPEAIQEIVKKIEHIEEMGGNMEAKLARLKTAYDSIINSEDPIVANSHDEVISNTIEQVMKDVKDTPLRDMSLAQLEAVYDMYRMVLHSIRTANKAFKTKKSEEISVIANSVLEEVGKLGKKKALRTKMGDAASTFDWNNLKPVYAFERIGSDSFTEVFNNVRAGEDTWAVDMTEAQEFLATQKQNHKYDSWDFDKMYKFTSSTGKEFSLSLGQIMSLYAYSKRGDQAKDHLRNGGFVFDGLTEVKQKGKLGVTKTYQLKDATAYNLNDKILADIISKLSTEQKAFADAMQDYLSTVMGEKGNEVSLELYGVKLFKEKNYFPLKSAPQFLERAREQAQGDVKIKNKGFTKETAPKASNPIVLTSFMDVWAGHVNEMSMYHAFTLALEDFYRVFNYKTPASETMDSESVISFLENAHGAASVSYIDQLLKDLNGGARSDPRETPAKALMSRFKKSAVIASLSVVAQQPTALVRAMALVDAKYFGVAPISRGVLRTFNPKKHKALWAEVKKYAPVAIIKEMGYFDTGMGKSSVEWLKGEKTFMDKVDDVLTKAPAVADELAWISIWEAVKRETAHNNTTLETNSEEFLKLAGERFTEVIVKTQVYDSTLAKSSNMRSKSGLMNMWTAFMAEPTTTINMVMDAFRKGDKKYIAKVLGATAGSIALNAALVSLVYAMRDDDEDETYLEKYLSRFTTELIDGINPVTYIPFFKDVWSIMQGFDIERTDMALINDLISTAQNAVKTLTKDTSDMDDEELSKHQNEVSEALWGIVDSISSLAGVPFKNLRRDTNGIINLFKTLGRDMDTSIGSLMDNIGEDIKASIPVWGWMPGDSKTEKLYEAIISGDTAYVERIKNGYKDEASYNTALRKALRENDSRIREAAEAYNDGDYDTYESILTEIVSEGHFDGKMVSDAIRSEAKAIEVKDEDTTEDSDEEDKDEAYSIYQANDINIAFENGDTARAKEIIADLIETKVANGMDEKKAKSSLRSSMTSYWKPLYKAASESERIRIRKILYSSGLYGSVDEVNATVSGWLKD